jgi:hypothetical protein
MPDSWSARILSSAAALTGGMLIASSAFADPAARYPPTGADTAIAPMIRQWFATLESPAPDARLAEAFPAWAPPIFSLSSPGYPGAGNFEAWLAELRSPYPQVAFRLEEIRVDGAGEGRVRARFAFERHAVDAAGIPHLARREQIWLIRREPGGGPVVLQIEEQRQLAFPGTGPQVVCY